MGLFLEPYRHYNFKYKRMRVFILAVSLFFKTLYVELFWPGFFYVPAGSQTLKEYRYYSSICATSSLGLVTN